MREIKFRAWVQGHMYFNHSVSLGVNGTVHFLHNDGEWEVDLHKEVTLMQFTGLTDRNGKEIYEGDILKSWYSRDTTGKDIVYTHEVVQYEIKDYEGIAGFELLFPQNTEVIGNIYENPELTDKN